MTANEIAKELKDKGFSATVCNDIVFAGLNRPVSFEEIFVALDGKVELEAMSRAKKNSIAILPEVL